MAWFFDISVESSIRYSLLAVSAYWRTFIGLSAALGGADAIQTGTKCDTGFLPVLLVMNLSK